MPKRRAVLMTRQAISPRLAIKMRLNMPRIDPASRPLRLAVSREKSQSRQHRREPWPVVAGHTLAHKVWAGLHEPVGGAPRAADVARDPGEHISVDIGRPANAGPIPCRHQPRG